MQLPFLRLLLKQELFAKSFENCESEAYWNKITLSNIEIKEKQIRTIKKVNRPYIVINSKGGSTLSGTYVLHLIRDGCKRIIKLS